MTRISRYIGLQVGAAILLVLAVLLGLDLLSKLIDQSGDLNDSYTMLAALNYALLTTPAEIYKYLPFAALVGCLAGLGTLATTSELVVIRAAGVSVLRIIGMSLQPALLITLLAILVSEYAAPPLAQLGESQRAMALQKDNVGIAKYGIWHREEDRFIHFNAVQADGEMYGVTIYQLDGMQRLASALFARRARFDGGNWILEDLSETRFHEDRLEQVTAPWRQWQTELSPELLSILMLDPLDLSIGDLWRYTHFLREQGANGAEYELAFWGKITQPLAIVSMVLVAVSILFGPLRQASMGSRVFAGVLIGIVFRIAQDMLGPSSLVFGFSPAYASLVPIAISVVAGAILLRRHI